MRRLLTALGLAIGLAGLSTFGFTQPALALKGFTICLEGVCFGKGDPE